MGVATLPFAYSPFNVRVCTSVCLNFGSLEKWVYLIQNKYLASREGGDLQNERWPGPARLMGRSWHFATIARRRHTGRSWRPSYRRP